MTSILQKSMSTTMNIERAEEIIGHPFIQRSLIEEALSTPGSHIGEEPGSDRDHRDLGVLGSALIKMIIFREWFPSGQDRSR